jgi:hypothetical protein
MYAAIPSLAAITANMIRITPNAAKHIAGLVIKKLYDLGNDVSTADPSLETNIINAIRFSIPRGMVLTSLPSDDMHNPLDRQLEIYTHADLSAIDPSFGLAKLKVYCRLGVMNKTLSLRTIQRNFEIEGKEPEPTHTQEREEQEDYDYDPPDYDIPDYDGD